MQIGIIKQCVEIIRLAEDLNLDFNFGEKELIEDLLQLVINFLKNRIG